MRCTDSHTATGGGGCNLQCSGYQWCNVHTLCHIIEHDAVQLIKAVGAAISDAHRNDLGERQ
jgi:hypothetical protein